MKPKGKEVNWKGVARLLNSANEALVENIRKQDQKYSILQVQYQKMQNLTMIINKGLN